MKTQRKTIFTAILLLLAGNIFAQTFSADSKDPRNQASFTSDAPFEKIVGISSGLHAMVMLHPENITNNAKGRVAVEINNIKTGIDLRDEHLRSENWLDAEKYPEAVFELTGIKNASSQKLSEGEKIEAVFAGKFSVHGVTKDVEAKGEITYYKESERTKAETEGNLLIVKAELKINLSDYGVQIPSMVVGKVNEEVTISTQFVASDAHAAMNPCAACGTMDKKGKCNPCAAMGKCNPCAVKTNPCNPCGIK